MAAVLVRAANRLFTFSVPLNEVVQTIASYNGQEVIFVF
tara:strand:+ start:515 stop:631 length:117 start_codon:yes stop_codon:yes gene_type:complete